MRKDGCGALLEHRLANQRYKIASSKRPGLPGTPEQLTEFLRRWEEKWPGVEHVMFHWPYGLSLEGFKEQLSIFASEVMPNFNGHR